jgi:hypothetical protein
MKTKHCFFNPGGEKIFFWKNSPKNSLEKSLKNIYIATILEKIRATPVQYFHQTAAGEVSSAAGEAPPAYRGSHGPKGVPEGGPGSHRTPGTPWVISPGKDGMFKIGSPDSGRKTRYRHGLPTHDNKNPMFCIIAYSPSKKLSLVQNSICGNLAGLNLWIFYR